MTRHGTAGDLLWDARSLDMGVRLPVLGRKVTGFGARVTIHGTSAMWTLVGWPGLDTCGEGASLAWHVVSTQ